MLRHSLCALLVLSALSGCERKPRQESAAAPVTDTGIAVAPTSRSEREPAGSDKVTNAMSAAPEAIARNATIMDWPEAAGGEPKQLRAGSNGWVCYPSTPKSVGSSGDDPMCLDKQFQGWGAALMSKQKPPQMKSVAVAYMLQGDAGVSNVDPYATGPKPDNQWVKTGPHVMVIAPDPAMLASVPTDPASGGPFVMWKGTPYAHIMVPIER